MHATHRWEASFLCPVPSGIPLPGRWGAEGKDVLGWSSGRQAEGREEMETVWPADAEVRELSLPFLATWANLLSKGRVSRTLSFLHMHM